MNAIIMVLIFALAAYQEVVAGPATTLPKNFLKCNKNDPNVSKCVLNAVEDSFKKMKSKGIPSLGVLPLDPLEVQNMKLNSGTPNDPVNLRIDFNNMKVHGIPETKFTDYKIDFENTAIHIVSRSPLISLVSDYKADGKVLILPVRGQGVANFTMTDMESVSDLKFKPEERNGEIHWILQNFDIRFQPKKMSMYFSGLISQDKTLSDGINNFINENWEVVLESIRPEFEGAFGIIF